MQKNIIHVAFLELCVQEIKFSCWLSGGREQKFSLEKPKFLLMLLHFRSKEEEGLFALSFYNPEHHHQAGILANKLVVMSSEIWLASSLSTVGDNVSQQPCLIHIWHDQLTDVKCLYNFRNANTIQTETATIWNKLKEILKGNMMS